VKGLTRTLDLTVCPNSRSRSVYICRRTWYQMYASIVPIRVAALWSAIIEAHYRRSGQQNEKVTSVGKSVSGCVIFVTGIKFSFCVDSHNIFVFSIGRHHCNKKNKRSTLRWRSPYNNPTPTIEAISTMPLWLPSLSFPSWTR
jgi:hypothetical protein